ncbi:MAG TPA: hypothetical protein VFJ77_03835 [Gaiellaceae bacterium]|nr:hypothetical protein [Gaiellaceae bacterium]
MKLDVARIGSRWKIGCWVCCPPETDWQEAGEYLRDLAAAVGCRPYELLTDPLAHVSSLLDGPPKARPKLPPPSEQLIQGWQSRLRSTDSALAYLIERRGLRHETIEQYELGYDGDLDAITLPVRDAAGELVNVKWRHLAPDADPKMTGLGGKGRSHLYPLEVLAADPLALVLCEGEFDALLLNQHGVPAVTSTAGTSWKPDWDPHVIGRRVAVLYDAGARSYEKAERRAAALVAAGARDSWPVDLTLCGFTKGEDVGDWVCKYRWPAHELVAFLNASRRWYVESQVSA